MPNESILKKKKQITLLQDILSKLSGVETVSEKIEILNESLLVKNALNDHLEAVFNKISLLENMLIKSLIVIGQKHIVSAIISKKFEISDRFMKVLKEINDFYETKKGSFDGLMVYHLHILQLILENDDENIKKINSESSSKSYLKPIGRNLAIDSKEVRRSIRAGIENLMHLGEIYPVGGAGERFNLNSLVAKKPLPVATLPFLGRSLLEGLIRDLEGREFLSYKLTGSQIKSKVAMMTSFENDNHALIENLCKQNNWFNRKEESFFLFPQPMVPVSTIEGEWLLADIDHLLLKPGGHGVIWKLGVEKGVFKWFKKHGKTKLLSRQINNPIAGVDSGLLGFCGVGFKGNYLFGFSSCDRILNTSEGMDILIQKKTNSGYEYKITNIEYTEFVKNGIEDCPESVNSEISKFPANTNILFLDLENIEKLADVCKVPGKLINMKSEVSHINKAGVLHKIKAGRLESTMQNAADFIIDKFPEKLKETEYHKLSTFLTYNKRIKTISVTKKSFTDRKSFPETPESCYFDVYKNCHDLFKNYCKMELPHISTVDAYLKNGPSVLINYHPALGPLYSVIAQKIRGGKIFQNSEMQLEIAEVEIVGLELDGSLIIQADHVTGSLDEKAVLEYGRSLGKFYLKNVKVKNLGVDRKALNTYWKNEITRHEALKIVIHGNGELIAEDVTLLGNMEIEVMDGERLTLSEEMGKIQFKREKVEKEKYWDYTFDADDHIILKRV